MAEAVAVVGLIGSIISITDAIKETYKIATEAHRLPEAFTVVNERIPIVQRTLSLVKSAYHATQDEDAIRESLTTCKEKAEDLKYIFEKVCIVEGESVLRRYSKALKTLKPGRGDKVENLFKDILDTLQTLQVYHIFKNIIPVEELTAAIEEIGSVESSIPESNSTTINSSGPGALFNSGSGQLMAKQQYGDGNYQAETMNFQAPAVQKTLVRNPTLQDPFHDYMLDRQRVDQSLFIPRTLAVQKLALKFRRKSKDQKMYRHAVVVHGMGGTGKTQLVLQYIEMYQHEYSTVLWIDATSPESYVLSCRRICIRLRLFDAKHHGSTQQALVPQRSMAVDHLLSWLVDRPSVDNWLVVIDNLDDMSWGMTNVVPRGKSGNLIVTSRDSFTATALGFPKFLVESMEKEEAANFLRIAAFRELDDSSDELEALCAEFCTLVDNLPLAIHLAAATIGGDSEVLELDDNITVRDACSAMKRHVERFNTNKDLLLMGDAHKYMQSPYPRTLLTTFETTFVKLREDSGPHTPPAMDLLRLLAFLDDGVVAQLHERFRLAYRGALTDRRHYATMHLSKWLSKLLTGESSLAIFPMLHRERSEWDNQGFRDTVGRLQRYGLVRPTEIGSSEIVPLHKIVRWRAQKEGENQIREVLSEYVIILQLALSSSMHNPDQILRLSDELADLYHILERSQDAFECAGIHLERSIKSYGRADPNTVRSLARIIEILCSQQRQGQVVREVFAFVRDAEDRDAVLEALPSDLLLIFQSVFSQHKKPDTTQHKKSHHALLDHQPDMENRSVVPSPIGLLGGGDIHQQTVIWPGEQIALFRPGQESRAIHEQISQQIFSRKEALQARSHTKPDLVTLFEVLSLGSSELISSYMRYINAETVLYRDPICGRTVLHFIAAHGKREDVQLCIEKGSDIKAVDYYGATPLQIADSHGRSHVFRGLIQDSAGDLAHEHPRMMRDNVIPPKLTFAEQVNLRPLEPSRRIQHRRDSGSEIEPVRSRADSESGDLISRNYSRQPYVEECDSDDSWKSVHSVVDFERTSQHSGRVSPDYDDSQWNTDGQSICTTHDSLEQSTPAVSEDEKMTEHAYSGSDRSGPSTHGERWSISLQPSTDTKLRLSLQSLHSRSSSTSSLLSRELSIHTRSHSESSETNNPFLNPSLVANGLTVPEPVPDTPSTLQSESLEASQTTSLFLEQDYDETGSIESVGRERSELIEMPREQPDSSEHNAKASPTSVHSPSLEVPSKSYTSEELLVGQDLSGTCNVLQLEEKREPSHEGSHGHHESSHSVGLAPSSALPGVQDCPIPPKADHIPPPKKKKRRRRRHHSSSGRVTEVHDSPSPDLLRTPEAERSAKKASQRSVPVFDTKSTPVKTTRASKKTVDRKLRDVPLVDPKSSRKRSDGGRALLSAFWDALTGRGGMRIEASRRGRR